MVAIARENCKKFSNVKVIPTSYFYGSRATISVYFIKDSAQGQKINPVNDITVFARYICPALGITHRFCGEEKRDSVTRQYNESLRELLPKYGIEFVEVPRIKVGDSPVSATDIRKLIMEGNIAKCRQYLPLESYDYIRRNLNRIVTAMKERRHE